MLVKLLKEPTKIRNQKLQLKIIYDYLLQNLHKRTIDYPTTALSDEVMGDECRWTMDVCCQAAVNRLLLPSYTTEGVYWLIL